MQAPKDALALQSEFKGSLYTQKLPINRTSGHYVTMYISDVFYFSDVFNNMFTCL